MRQFVLILFPPKLEEKIFFSQNPTLLEISSFLVFLILLITKQSYYFNLIHHILVHQEHDNHYS
ncbi:hypothetical protein LguiA_001906 [Lonicera macranthoides]